MSGDILDCHKLGGGGFHVDLILWRILTFPFIMYTDVVFFFNDVFV